jgi:hypothetical protein
LRVRTIDHILGDMFSRHRSHPDLTTPTPFRDRLSTVATSTRADSQTFNAAMVRGRLAGSATVGLRDRLARQPVVAPRS